MARTRALSHSEKAVVLSYLRAKPNLRDYLLLRTLCATGFRIKEALSLRVCDVAIGQVIRSEITLDRKRMKGGRGDYKRSVRTRRVVLSDTLRKEWEVYLSERYTFRAWPGDEVLFASRNGENNPLSRRHAYEIIRGAARACGITGAIGCHSGRKTFAQEVYDRTGHCLMKTQRALGHANITTTCAYLFVDDADVDEAVRSLDGNSQSLRIGATSVQSLG